MATVIPCSVPAGTALSLYASRGAYTDCYATTLPCAITQAEFVEAFYTTAVFKIERALIALFLSRRSTDADARELAQGGSSHFAAWAVEHRDQDQLLLAAGPTRSWLMATPLNENGRTGTRLHFGSAVVPRPVSGTSERKLGWQFGALLGFHRLYSRILLSAATRRLSGR